MSIINFKNTKTYSRITAIKSDNPLVEAVCKYVIDNHEDINRIITAPYYPRGNTHSVGFDYTKILKDNKRDETLMRVSPCGYAAKSLEEALMLAEVTAKVTHSHPEGIKGVQAVAAAIFHARNGKNISEISEYINTAFYQINFTIDEIRPTYRFDVSCQGSVPQALQAFFESSDFEDAVRNAISIGGDSDTIAAIAGSIAEAYYGIPDDIKHNISKYLDKPLLEIYNAFEAEINNNK